MSNVNRSVCPRGRGRFAWCAAAALMMFSPVLAVAAETGQSSTAKTFSIAAQSLASALDAFAQTSGWQVGYASALTSGLTSPGVSGALDPAQALTQLLSGTGLTWRHIGPASVTLEKVAADGAMVLDPVTVQGAATAPASQTAWSPVQGYVAKHSAAATKTDTPISETPQTVTVITRDQMNDRDVLSVTDALSYTAGVIADPYGARTSGRFDWPFVRGFDSVIQGLYVDGLRLQASAPMEQMDSYGVERVDVMSGPSSVLYGQNSPGGVINMITKRPSADHVNEVRLEAGNNDRRQGAFDLGGALNEGKTLSYRAVGVRRDSDTQVDGLPDDRVFFAPSLRWNDGDTDLVVRAGYQKDRTAWEQWRPAAGTVLDNPNGDVPDIMLGNKDFDRFEREQYSLSTQLEHRFNETWTVRQNARHSYVEWDGSAWNALGFSGNRYVTMIPYNQRTTMNVDALDNQLQATVGKGDLQQTVLAGIDYLRSDYTANTRIGGPQVIDIYNPTPITPVISTPYSNTRNVMEQTGLYVQDQIKAWERLNILLGMRRDWADATSYDRLRNDSTSRADQKNSYRAGLLYAFDDGVSPYVSYSTSFTPTAGRDRFGNTFKPIEGEQYEVGVKYQPPGSESMITLSAYDLTQNNVLKADPDATTFNIQAGEVEVKGLELGGTAELTPELRMVGSVTRMEAEITKASAVTNGQVGNTPSGVPSTMASLWLDYHFEDGPLAGLGFGGGARYISSSYAGDDNLFKVPDYTLYDAAIHYTFGEWTMALSARNLLDKEYVASCGSVTSCHYGARRTVVGSVTYRW